MTEFPNIPNFDVMTTVGSGGMGRVYLAKHRGAYGFEKLLAVKVIHPDRDRHGGVRAMFLDEARLVAQLHHPAIAQVYDFGESDGALFLVMEFVPGVSIAEILLEGIRPPPLICASIMAAVCRGLHAAHETKDVQGRPLNVVHRDVTPGNLVLTFAGQMKILDFGIALMSERSAPITGIGQIRGKPTYFSPEQVEGEPIDRRTDIYAVSIVLYEILTGQKLFTMDDFWGARPTGVKCWKDVAARVPLPSQSRGAPLPAGLDAIVLKGLAVEASDRYQDARAMAVDLEAIIEREGCETLESFVERELATHRTKHEERMRAVLGGAPEKGIDQHPGTLDDDNPPPAREVLTQPSPEDPLPEPVPEEALPEPKTVVGKPPAPRVLLHAAAAALFTVVLVTVLLLTRGEPEPEPAPPPAPMLLPPPVTASREPVQPKPEVLLPPPPAPSPVPRVRAKPMIRKKVKKPPAPKKPSKRVSKPVAADGIITEW